MELKKIYAVVKIVNIDGYEITESIRGLFNEREEAIKFADKCNYCYHAFTVKEIYTDFTLK